MYAWIFRHLPGPTWFKVIESLILIGAAVAALLLVAAGALAVALRRKK